MAGAADFFATLFLLSSHHLLSLALGIFKSFLLLKSLCFFLLCLSSLLLGELFLLLDSDFLSLGLFLLQSLELLFFLTPFFPPLVNVFFQLIIQLALLGFIFGRSHDV